MKKLSLLSLMVVVFLQGCSLFGPTEIPHLSITLAPVEVPGDLLRSSEAFKSALNEKMNSKGYNLQSIDITIPNTNKEATQAVIDGKTDLAFLPIMNYVGNKETMNVFASSTHTRLALGDQDLSVYNGSADAFTTTDILPYRYSLIYTGPSVYGQSLYSKFKNNEEITWIDLNQAKWCHVVVTSLDGYIYPSLWLINHYERRMGELFDHTLEVKGYVDVMRSLADESCDVGVGPDTLRLTYASQWKQSTDNDGFGRSADIFSEVHVIGISSKIYDNVFVTRLVKAEDEETLFTEKFTKALQDSLLELANDPENKLEFFKLLGFEGLTLVDPLEYDSMIPAYDYIQQIMN